MNKLEEDLMIVRRLALDAIELKVANGWYGDSTRGHTTEAEDREALEHVEGFVKSDELYRQLVD